MDHSQAQDLLPGYALGALETSEQETLLEHLQFCSACYELGLEHAELASRLASGIAVAEPPAGLQHRLRDSLSETGTAQSVTATAPRPSIIFKIRSMARRFLRLVSRF